jgi:hypothetical protein
MENDERDLVRRWRSAVVNLRLGAERVQATADDLPLDLALAAGASLVRVGQSDPLRRHMNAFADYTTALNCIQVLLAAHKAGTL